MEDGKNPYLVPLTLILVLLKLNGIISWSWFIVTSPIWIGFALVFIVYGVAGFLDGFKTTFKIIRECFK